LSTDGQQKASRAFWHRSSRTSRFLERLGFGVHPAACREENGEAQTYAKGAAFKKGQRFRAGIEGRISVLFRGRGMQRCLAEGRQRFQALAGAAALANNLMRIAAMLAQRSSCRPRAAQRDLSACLPLRLTRFPCAQSIFDSEIHGRIALRTSAQAG
jgi:hypothetical protein